jgi:hypothetical protein
MSTNYFNGLSKEEAIKELAKLGIKFEATKWNRKIVYGQVKYY